MLGLLFTHVHPINHPNHPKIAHVYQQRLGWDVDMLEAFSRDDFPNYSQPTEVEKTEPIQRCKFQWYRITMQRQTHLSSSIYLEL